MLSKCFSYYNYKITQNIDIPILFFLRMVASLTLGYSLSY